jgi:hypothetical protein
MKTILEYRKHAQECRALARLVPPGEQREQLLQMAATWDKLAQTREGFVRNHPELGTEQAARDSESSPAEVPASK